MSTWWICFIDVVTDVIDTGDNLNRLDRNIILVISFCILARDPIRVFFRRIGVYKVQVADEFFAYNSMDRTFKLTLYFSCCGREQFSYQGY